MANSVLEVTPERKIVWELHQHDLPSITLAWVTTLEVLPNGNYVIGNCHAIAAPHVLRRPAVRAGLARLASLGLTFDAWVFHPQLAEVIEIARAFPGLSIIMGHAGGALGYGPYQGRRDEVYASWKASMTELAKCPNVVVKLGGMLIRLAAFDYLAVPTPPSLPRGPVLSGGGAVVGPLMPESFGGGLASPPPQAATSNDIATPQTVRARSFVSRFMVSS